MAENGLNKRKVGVTLTDFDEEFALPPEEEPTLKERVCKTVGSCCTCSADCAKKKFLSFFPFVDTIRTYRLREYILNDLVAGLSVGVIHIPQGMGFALLTSLPAVFGLYSSFFPVIVYFFFATSRHNSAGTMALISLMIGAVADREAPLIMAARGYSEDNSMATMVANTTNSLGYVTETLNKTIGTADPGSIYAQQYVLTKVEVAMSMSLLIGVFQILMSFMRMGILTTLMPLPFIQGFTTGAAFHIASSQFKFMFGLKVQRFEGAFQAPRLWIAILSKIDQTNVAELLTALICLIILILLKECVNERFKSKMRVPIPAELIVVIIGTLISHYAKFSQNFNVKIIGKIPRGIPTPAVPTMQNAQNYIAESFIAGVVGFAISISMAKIFTKKYDYEVDTNQEMFAYGMCNAVGSFFSSFGGCVAPPRCMVHDSVGGRTQVASIFSSLLVLLVVVAIGPLFQSLPNSVLAAIIIMALKPMFWQLKQLPWFWKVNKYDFTIWLVTWLSVVILDITYGLVIGIIFSVFIVIIQSQRTKGEELKLAGDSFVPASRYKTDDLNRIKIFRFNSSVYFANADQFKSQLYEHIGKPMSKPPMAKSINNAHVEVANDSNQNDVHGTELKNVGNGEEEVILDIPMPVIIIDCSPIGYLDSVGLGTLTQIHAEFKKANEKVVLANVRSNVMECIEKGDLRKKIGEDSIFLTVDDAVRAHIRDTN